MIRRNGRTWKVLRDVIYVFHSPFVGIILEGNFDMHGIRSLQVRATNKNKITMLSGDLKYLRGL